MSCGPNPFCAPTNPKRYIKMVRDRVSVIEGAQVLSQVDLCGLDIVYTNQQTNRYVIKSGQTNVILDWGILGDTATFVLLRATYQKNAINPYLIWSFVDENSSYPMKDILWLTGDSALGIKKIKISNPSSSDVRLEVLVAGTEQAVLGYDDSTFVSNIAFNSLTIDQIRTWSNDTIYVGTGPGYTETELFININNIGNIERSGRFIVIDDLSIGEILLGIDTEANAIEMFAALNYLKNNVANHNITYTLPLPVDVTAPVITFTPAVIGVGPYSTTMFLSGYGGTIIKTNLITHAILSVIDNRDGIMNITANNVTINPGNINTITAIGTYNVDFTVTDLAGNSYTTTIEFDIFA